MLVDTNFNVKKGIKAGAVHGITIKNAQRSLVLKCRSQTQQIEWYDAIEHMLNNDAKLFNQPNRYTSYAPIRQKQLCRWYINGASYMEAVLNGILAAKEEIFITDWWMSPEVFLKRPTADLQYRLDKVLLKKAVSFK